MSNSERDYSDYRNTPFHEHGDQVPSNRSTNLTMYDVIDARTSRRDFLVGGLTALATGLFGAGLASLASSRWRCPRRTRPSSLNDTRCRSSPPGAHR
jgi:uncharacterized protein